MRSDIRIWRVPGWDAVKTIELLDDPHCVTFLPDARTLVACDSAGTIRKFSAEAGAARSATAGQPWESLQAWKAHADGIFKMTICRRTRELITAGRDGTVEAWSLAHDESSKVLHDGKADVEDFLFIPGTNRLALTDGHAISLWDAESLTQIRVLGRTEASIRCLAISCDGSTLAAGGLGGFVRLYDLNDDGRESERNVGRAFNVYRACLSPDGRLAAAIDRYNSEKRDDLYVWNTRTRQRLERIRLAACNSATFSPDGRWLFASGPSNVVTVWNVQTQEKVSEQPGHQTSINCIQFAPFAPWAATAGDDRLIKIWSTVDWQFKFNLEGDADRFAVSPSRPTVALWLCAAKRVFSPSGTPRSTKICFNR